MNLQEILIRDNKLVYRTRGVSMEPMLRQNRDLVIIYTCSSRLKKYDVAFYKRGSNYVLHRVINVLDDGYVIRGDNTYVDEHILDQDILGILVGFKRKGKYYEVTNKNYLRYVRFWTAIYPLRRKLYQLKKIIKKILKYCLIHRKG